MGNILIARNGSSISGNLLDRFLTMRTELGALRLKTSAIAWIHFKGTPGTPTDEIWLHNGDRLTGRIVGTQVRWRDSTKRALAVPFRKIHSIVLSEGAS